MRTTAKKKPYSAGITAAWLVILLVFVGEFFLYTWCRVQCMRLRYAISAEKETAVRLAEEKKDLKIEIARLGSPARIMKMAKEKGMIMPTSEQVIILP